METAVTVRFGGSGYVDHVVWHEGSTEGVGRYVEEMVDHFHVLSGKFRLYSPGLEDPGNGN